MFNSYVKLPEGMFVSTFGYTTYHPVMLHGFRPPFDPFSGDAQRRVHRDHSEYGGKGSLCSCGGPGEICGDRNSGRIGEVLEVSKNHRIYQGLLDQIPANSRVSMTFRAVKAVFEVFV